MKAPVREPSDLHTALRPSFYLGRLVAAFSRLGSRGVHRDRRPVALIKIMLFGIITVNSARWRGETTDTSVAEYKRSQDERLRRRPGHLSRLSCEN